MTDAKKNENSKAAVAELLGERKRPWYVRAVPAAVVLALAAVDGIGGLDSNRDLKRTM